MLCNASAMVGTGFPKSSSCVTITAWLISIEGNAGVSAFVPAGVAATFVTVAPGTVEAPAFATAFVPWEESVEVDLPLKRRAAAAPPRRMIPTNNSHPGFFCDRGVPCLDLCLLSRAM